MDVFVNTAVALRHTCGALLVFGEILAVIIHGMSRNTVVVVIII